MTDAQIRRLAPALAFLCSLGASAAAAQTSGAPLALGPVQLAGDEASYLDLGVGTFGTRMGHVAPEAGEARVELRYGKKLFYLGPALGLLATTKGGVFGCGGFMPISIAAMS
jgi:lipid A 3-O-deacylase